MDFYNWRTQLRKGLLEMAVLNFLQHGQYYGYDIVQALRQIKGLEIRVSNVYPILTRLQIDSLITSHTEPTQKGPPRKHYKITKQGIKILSEMNTHWDQITKGIQSVRKGF